MSKNTLQVGDIGTIIIIDVGISAEDIIECKIYVNKPGGDKAIWNAMPKNGTTEIYHITEEGDLDVDGTYQIQAWIKTSNWSGRGRVAVMKVEKNI